MPDINGTSTRGPQSISNGLTITNAQPELRIPSFNNLFPQRLGFLYIVAFRTAIPSQQRVIATELVYGPGNALEIPAGISLANNKFSIYIDWNVSGVPFVFSYS